MNADAAPLSVKPPVCWKVAPGVSWIQVHCTRHARALRKRSDTHLVSYSVHGPYLQVHEMKQPLHVAKQWIARQLAKDNHKEAS